MASCRMLLLVDPPKYGPVGRRDQLGDGHPPAAAHEDARPGQQQLPDPLAAAAAARPTGRPARTRARPGTPGASWPGTRSPARRRPARATGIARSPAPGPWRTRAHGQQQDQQRVRVVEPEHQRRDRGQRQDQSRDEPGRRAEPPAHRRVQHGDGGHPLERLRDQHAPVIDAEDPPRQLHHPQRGRGLVHGDEAGGVEGAEEERLPALGPGVHRGGVEVVGPAVAAEVDQVQERGQGQQPEQGGPGPARVAPAPRSSRFVRPYVRPAVRPRCAAES